MIAIVDIKTSSLPRANFISLLITLLILTKQRQSVQSPGPRRSLGHALHPHLAVVVGVLGAGAEDHLDRPQRGVTKIPGNEQ